MAQNAIVRPALVEGSGTARMPRVALEDLLLIGDCEEGLAAEARGPQEIKMPSTVGLPKTCSGTQAEQRGIEPRWMQTQLSLQVLGCQGLNSESARMRGMGTSPLQSLLLREPGPLAKGLRLKNRNTPRK